MARPASPDPTAVRSPSSVGGARRSGRRQRPREWRKEKREERRWLTKVATTARRRIGMESDDKSLSWPCNPILDLNLISRCK